jgi:hypothetical protein
VPHFANFPLAALQRVAFAGALSGHLMNLPFASRQGAAMDGAAVARRPTLIAATMSLRMKHPSFDHREGHAASVTWLRQTGFTLDFRSAGPDSASATASCGEQITFFVPL